MISENSIEELRNDVYECCSSDICNKLEVLITDYKKLQEEFNQVDHECSRLEQEEIILEKQHEELCLKYDLSLKMSSELIENSIPIPKIQNEIEELNRKVREMKPYKDISPFNFGYWNGCLDYAKDLIAKWKMKKED